MILMSLFAAAAMKPDVQSLLDLSWKQTRVVGHRGAAAYQPENTLPSFREAIASQADATECDVHLSRDGEMVIMHDGKLDRTTSLKGEIKETDAATLRGAGIPFLSDLTNLTKDKIVLVVEIKDGDGVEQKVVDHLKAQDMVPQSIVFGFDVNRVQKVKSLNPKQTAVWLVAQKLEPTNFGSMFDRLAAARADAFGVQYRNCSPELVAEAHRRKIPVFVWTVPPGPEVDRLKGLKVNFIITDHPRDVRKQLGL